ncbi:MAG TPA: hypothetical protein VHM30_08130 [Gemmatimonadaceae bacterium]|nr:hypothetical protein [Gemmatimonadaceae bacterium]
MRKTMIALTLAAAASMAACKKTGEGEYEVQKPVIGTTTDTVHTPSVEVGTDTHTVTTPKVEVKKDSTKIVTPKVTVKKP